MSTVRFQKVTNQITQRTGPHSSLPPLPVKPRLRRYTGKVEDIPYMPYQQLEAILERTQANHMTKPLRSALVFYIARIVQAYMDGISAGRLKSITAPTDTIGLEYIRGKIEELRISIMKDVAELEILVKECAKKPCELRPRVNLSRPARRSNMCACKSACPDKLLLYVGLFKDAFARRNVTEAMNYSNIVKQYE